MKVYYLDQKNWTDEDFYALHRYLHRMFTTKNRRMDEIESIDPSLLSEKTKVLMYCVIEYYQIDDVKKMSNFSWIKSIEPLKEELRMSERSSGNDIYKRMNVIY